MVHFSNGWVACSQCSLAIKLGECLTQTGEGSIRFGLFTLPLVLLFLGGGGGGTLSPNVLFHGNICTYPCQCPLFWSLPWDFFLWDSCRICLLGVSLCSLRETGILLYLLGTLVLVPDLFPGAGLFHGLTLFLCWDRSGACRASA